MRTWSPHCALVRTRRDHARAILSARAKAVMVYVIMRVERRKTKKKKSKKKMAKFKGDSKETPR